MSLLPAVKPFLPAGAKADVAFGVVAAPATQIEWRRRW